jgi:hypothetical protein
MTDIFAISPEAVTALTAFGVLELRRFFGKPGFLLFMRARPANGPCDLPS